jgi:pimeloyl-ACP methyl ester carboxylesterase
MEIVERGSGDPLVLIPGLQGRWEYLGPAIESLAASYRVLTFPLCDEPASRMPIDPTPGIDRFANQVEQVLNALSIHEAAICGISFGGLIALRFAARHPDRTSALILVSTPGPQWHLRPRHGVYARLPHIFGPIFLAESPFRLRQEVRVALPDTAGRSRFVKQQLRALVSAPLSMSRMAARARAITGHDREADASAVSAPTLVVHGEPSLDHVVDAQGTSAYASLIRGAREETLVGTGHLGSITKPDLFAGAVTRFLQDVRLGSRDSAA